MRKGFYALLITGFLSFSAQAERLKDISDVQGVRDNKLIGYGLVVGLDGTGDKAKFTSTSMRNFLNNFGVNVPDNVDPKSKNVAAVSLSAELPPFAKPRTIY